jgi:hypothetical protein
MNYFLSSAEWKLVAASNFVLKTEQPGFSFGRLEQWVDGWEIPCNLGRMQPARHVCSAKSLIPSSGKTHGRSSPSERRLRRKDD